MEWISVDDRLPGSEKVIVWDAVLEEPSVGWFRKNYYRVYRGGNEWLEDAWQCLGQNYKPARDVTHWMLPDPPQAHEPKPK